MMNSNGAWQLLVKESVLKTLSRFPHKTRARLERAINLLPQNPYAGDIEKMKGEPFAWRRRIGDYRIFYELIPSERTIVVSRAERRTSSTY